MPTGNEASQPSLQELWQLLVELTKDVERIRDLQERQLEALDALLDDCGCDDESQDALEPLPEDETRTYTARRTT